MPGAEYVTGVDASSAALQSYTYEPNAEALLNDIVPRFTRLQVYQSLLEVTGQRTQCAHGGHE